MVFPYEKVIPDHKLTGTLMEPVADPCTEAIVADTGVGEGTVEIDGLDVNVTDNLSLVRQIWVFTLAVQIALIRAGIRRFLYSVYRLEKNIIDERIVCQV